MGHFLRFSVSEFSSMDGVPLKMPQGPPQEVKEDVKIIIPDYLVILQETEVCMFLLFLYVYSMWNKLQFLLVPCLRSDSSLKIIKKEHYSNSLSSLKQKPNAPLDTVPFCP